MPNTVLTKQNYLSSTRAVITIPGLDNLSLTATAWNLPGVSTGSPLQVTTSTDIPHTGDDLLSDVFRIEFMVLEDLSNWIEIYKWIISITDPRRTTNWTNKQGTYLTGNMIISSSHNNPIAEITFNNMIPITLTEIPFLTAYNETDYIKCTAEFRYSDFIIKLPDGTEYI